MDLCHIPFSLGVVISIDTLLPAVLSGRSQLTVDCQSLFDQWDLRSIGSRLFSHNERSVGWMLGLNKEMVENAGLTL